MSDMSQEYVCRRWQKIFAEFDKNGDGMITRSELKAVFNGMPEEDLDKLLNVVDVNQNGVIDYKEFVDWLMDGENAPTEVASPSMRGQSTEARDQCNQNRSGNRETLSADDEEKARLYSEAARVGLVEGLLEGERELLTMYRTLPTEFKEEVMTYMHRIRSRMHKSEFYKSVCTDAHRELTNVIMKSCGESNDPLGLDLQEFKTVHAAVQAVQGAMVEHGDHFQIIDEDFHEEFKNANTDDSSHVCKDELLIWLWPCSRGARVLDTTSSGAKHVDGSTTRWGSEKVDLFELHIFMKRVALHCQSLENVNKFEKISKLQRAIQQYETAFQRLRRDPDYNPVLHENVGLGSTLQPSGMQTVEDLLKHGSKIKPFVEGVGETLCVALAAPFWTMGPLKGRNRSHNKVNQDYNGNVRRLLDVVRFSVVCENMAMIHEAIERLRSMDDVEIARVKSGFDPKMRFDCIGGYRDVKVNCRHVPSGYLFEVQLHLLIFYSLKRESGHEIYVWSRLFAVQGIVDVDDVLGVLTPVLLEEMMHLSQSQLSHAIRNRGKNSLHAARWRRAIASIAQLTYQVDTAEKYINEILQQVEGEGIPATTERDVAEFYLSAGKRLGSCFSQEKALSFIEKGRALILETPEEERELSDFLYLARCDFEIGCWHFPSETTNRLLESTMEVFRSMLGEKHPKTLEVAKSLGGSKRMTNHNEEAIALLKASEKHCLETVGMDHRLTADTYLELGQCHELEESWCESLKCYRQCTTVREKTFGEHPKTGTCYTLMGRCHLKNGDVVAGKRELVRALALYERYLETFTEKGRQSAAYSDATKRRDECIKHVKGLNPS